jgi:hypothetical protein
MTFSRGRTAVATALAGLTALAVTGSSGAAGGRDEADGKGVYPDPTGSLAFDFRAVNVSRSGDEARGKLEIRNRSTGSRLRGEVICLQLEGSARAVVAGRITSLTGVAPGGSDVGPGDSFLFFAEDDGKSKSASDRLAVFTFSHPAPTIDLCNADQSGPHPIESGRITVRDR